MEDYPVSSKYQGTATYELVADMNDKVDAQTAIIEILPDVLLALQEPGVYRYDYTASHADLVTIASAPTVKENATNVYIKAKEFSMLLGGKVYVTFQMERVDSYIAYCDIRINGISVITPHEKSTAGYAVFNSTINVQTGDALELWIKTSGTSGFAKCRIKDVVLTARVIRTGDSTVELD